MTAYYNELDPYAAQWLRNLIAAGHIADGVVDERSIADVQPADLSRFTQCHFFAGIGVWSHALRSAGWADDRPVWTGSCPCQPFSSAGKQTGTADERHLWPVWFDLIRQCRPAVVFGEQVEAAIRHGWLDLVQADLEGSGYAFAAAGIPAAGVGAPHIRQRLWFVADTNNSMYNGCREFGAGGRVEYPDSGGVSRMGPDDDAGLEGLGSGHQAESGYGQGAVRSVAEAGEFGGLADDSTSGRREECSDAGRHIVGDRAQGRPAGFGNGSSDSRSGPTNGHWRDADWLYCRDGKWRPVESCYEQMVDGSARSLGRVRPSAVAEIEEEINVWAARYKTDAGEALRNLWRAFQQEAFCEREIGRFSGVQSPAVLLAFLRQLTEQGWHFSDALSCCCEEASRIVLRVLQFDNEAARAPLRRELAEQFGGQLADALRELSSILARHATQSWGDACREKTGAASFPLTQGAPSRVGRLRAYGNAIVSQAAQEMIAAYMSVRP